LSFSGGLHKQGHLINTLLLFFVFFFFQTRTNKMARILSTSNRMLIPSSRLNTLLPTAGQVLTSQDIHRRAFTATPQNQAGGKNKIKVSNKGKFKDHPLGGPGMEEAFDIERDLAKPFAMEDVPAVTHLRWAEARKRLNKLRAIKFQMPELTS
jgi:hypothetical protein